MVALSGTTGRASLLGSAADAARRATPAVRAALAAAIVLAVRFALAVAGLTALCISLWTLAPAAGWAGIGTSCLVLEWMIKSRGTS